MSVVLFSIMLCLGPFKCCNHDLGVIGIADSSIKSYLFYRS